MYRRTSFAAIRMIVSFLSKRIFSNSGTLNSPIPWLLSFIVVAAFTTMVIVKTNDPDSFESIIELLQDDVGASPQIER